MKYCGECGAQLEDDDLFCGECGTKQETIVSANVERHNDIDDSVFQLPEIVTANDANNAKPMTGKGIPDWVVAIALVLCFPLVQAFWMIEWLFVLPDLIFGCVFFGLQIVALAMMFSKKRWPIWIKIIVLMLYILFYLFFYELLFLL